MVLAPKERGKAKRQPRLPLFLKERIKLSAKAFKPFYLFWLDFLIVQSTGNTLKHTVPSAFQVALRDEFRDFVLASRIEKPRCDFLQHSFHWVLLCSRQRTTFRGKAKPPSEDGGFIYLMCGVTPR